MEYKIKVNEIKRRIDMITITNHKNKTNIRESLDLNG